MNTSIKELQTLSDREVYFRIAERVEEYWGSQGCFDEVLRQKWQMAAYADSNPFLGGCQPNIPFLGGAR